MHEISQDHIYIGWILLESWSQTKLKEVHAFWYHGMLKHLSFWCMKFRFIVVYTQGDIPLCSSGIAITYSVLISHCFALHPYEKHELIKTEWVIVYKGDIRYNVLMDSI